MKNVNIYPSLLGCDLANVEREIRRCEAAEVNGLHYDVMDGNFVSGISFGELLFNRIMGLTDLPVDVHLMTANPLRHIEAYAGASGITAHIEALVPGIAALNFNNDTAEILINDKMREQINRSADIFFNAAKAVGAAAGIAVSPATPAYAVKSLCEIDRADTVLIMTVEPGKGSQNYISSMTPKITRIADIVFKTRHIFPSDMQICVDGGINAATAAEAVKAGATGIIAGSFLFGNNDMAAAVKQLRR